MELEASNRLMRLGSAIFAEVAKWKEEARAKGLDLIDLGIGSPDQPPSETVMNVLAREVCNPNNFGYPSSEGSLKFRQTVAKWYAYRFGVDLNAQHEVLELMGSQDGLAHLALAVTNPSDIAIVPNPGYPIYSAGLELAEVTPFTVPLKEGNDYLPELDKIPVEIASKAKFMILNYPSNPLSAVADRAFFEKVVAFAHHHRILIAHDLAYSEMAFDGYMPMSILEVEGAKEVAVEFHSLSKSFNMAGCRIGFMVGHSRAIEAVRTLKSNIDYGIFLAVQKAGIAALEEDITRGTHLQAASIYQSRRDIVLKALREAGWHISTPKATMFIWARIPQDWTSRQISREILLSTGVAVIPGDAFGSEGEGYIRIALVQNEEKLREAVRRIGEWSASHLKRM